MFQAFRILAIIMVTCTCCASLTAQQAAAGQSDKNADIEQLKQKVNELAVAFEDFKRTNVELAEALSQASTTILPVGSITAFSGAISSIPENWHLCDGSPVSSASYPVLWARIGTTWGGSGANAFKLPDLRGRFLRGVDGGTNRDQDIDQRAPNGNNQKDAAGSTQEDAIQIHRHADAGHAHSSTKDQVAYTKNHYACPGSCGGLDVGVGVFENTVKNGNAQITDPTSSSPDNKVRVGKETRVKNSYVYWIIRVK